MSGLVVEKSYRLGNGWDVLGTVIGAARGGLRATSDSFASRLVAALADSVLRVAFRILRSRVLHGLCDFEDQRYPIFLSNLFVYRKALADCNPRQSKANVNAI